jgi:myo-inositol-1(or 4)-monophosphatase
MQLATWHAERGVEAEYKDGGSPVTVADREIDELLRAQLPESGDGWLSEESPDNEQRLSCERVWVVDPVDGTRSFVEGQSDYSVSIALLINRQPVLGAVGAPGQGVQIVGAVGHGVEILGEPDWQWSGDDQRPRVLALRSEIKRGHWQHLEDRVSIQPVGSIAYMLAAVAAGCADATWTKYPKHEWDVAAGAALLHAVNGECWLPRGGHMLWNRKRPRFLSFAGAGSEQRSRIADHL